MAADDSNPAPETAREKPDLWGALQRKEPGACERLEGRIQDVCGGVFRRSGARPEQLASLLQDVLVSVWGDAARLLPAPSSLDGFLYWRAKTVWSEWRREARRRGIELSLEVIVNVSASDRPPDTLALGELKDALSQCRDSLEQQYRQVWSARYDQGLDPEQTANLLGLEKTQVAVRLHRARHLIADCLRIKKVLP